MTTTQSPPLGPAGRRVPPKKRPAWKRALPIAILATLFVMSIGAGYVAVRASIHHRPFTREIVNLFIPPPEEKFGKDRIQVLVLGIDYNYTDKDIEFSKEARSDTIWSVAMDFPTRAISQLAVPRDMMVVSPSGGEDKINAAYAIGGVPLASQTIGTFLGLPKNDAGTYYDRFVVLRVDAAKDLINAIGGIDVPVDKQMDYDDSWGHLHIHFSPGIHHMNGDEAVSYSRFRHDAEGDIARIRRQQQVMRLAIEKLKKDKFNDLSHINALLNVARKDIFTNFTLDEQLSIATAYAEVDQKQIRTGQVPFTGDKDIAAGNVLIPDDTGKAKLVQELLLGPLGAPPTTPPEAIAAIKPADVTIEVLNGTGVSGVGAKFADALKAKGYVVTSVGNADSASHDITEIREHSKLEAAGARVRSDLPGIAAATLTPVPLASGAPVPKTDLTIVVGNDFATSLTASPASTASPAK